MANSTNIQLPLLEAAQAQKHVTVNDGLQALDVIVQLSVKDRDLTAPPGSPADGDRYIVGSSATGAWASQDKNIAAYQDGVWRFYNPREGWRCWVDDEDILLLHDGVNWADYLVQILDAANTWTAAQTISGADARLRLHDDDDASSYVDLDHTAGTQFIINLTANTGQALIDINPRSSDGASGAEFRFFRSTNTTGVKRLTLHKGDGTGSKSAQVGVGGTNSYFGIDGGFFGIGTTSPGAPLAVNRSADGAIVNFESADSVEGNVSIAGTTTSYNAFVGSHYTQLKAGQSALPLGAVVIATGEIISSSPVASYRDQTVETTETEALETITVDAVEIDETAKPAVVKKYRMTTAGVLSRNIEQRPTKTTRKTIKQLKDDYWLDDKTGKLFTTRRTASPRDVSGVKGKEYFPHIDTTSTAADARVYGVWCGKMSDDARGLSFGQDALPVYLISQVGLFKVRVTDTNGNISTGNWLETSTRPMEAQKQDAKEKLNSTLGKALMDVAWAGETVDPALGYKWKLIPVIF